MKIEHSKSEKEKQELNKLLDEYNEKVIGKNETIPFMFTIKDAKRNLQGGIYGVIFFQWMYIDTFILKENYRNKGFGQKLFNQTEEFAVEKNCNKIMLYTHDFQSLKFYLKNGFNINETIKDLPVGYNRYTMIKELL